MLLVLTANRGLCGGYNSNVFRQGWARYNELRDQVPQLELEISGKRGISSFRYRTIKGNHTFTHFEDKPSFDEVDVLASRYLDEYITGKLDRLDVAYTRFESLSKQIATVETLLPLSSLGGPEQKNKPEAGAGESMYEFLPSAESILEEVVPTSFKVKAVQVLPRLGRQRADRPHGRHESRHRKRRRPDQTTQHAIQPRPAEPDHRRDHGRHRRRRSPQLK